MQSFASLCLNECIMEPEIWTDSGPVVSQATTEGFAVQRAWPTNMGLTVTT